MPGNPAVTNRRATLTPDQVIALWVKAGGKLSTAPMALARAYSESSLDATATSSNPDGGTNVGLYQLDTPGGVGSGHTAEELQDPWTNTKITVKATQGGTNWSEWADDYQEFLSQSQADVQSFQSKASSGGGVGQFVDSTLKNAVTGALSWLFPGGSTWLSRLESDTGVGADVGEVSNIGAIAGALGDLGKDFESLGKITTWLQMPSNWVRIFAGIFGAALLGAGVYLVGKEARA